MTDNIATRLGAIDRWLGRQHLGTVLLLIYAVAAATALAVGQAIAFRSGVAALDYDEWEYWQLSSDLLAGTFDDPGRRTLGYPALLAGLRLIADDFQLVQVALALCAAFASPILTWMMLRMGAGLAPAVLAGLALAVWPPHLFLAASLYSEAIALPLLLLFLGLLPKGLASHGARATLWLGCGALLGLLAHVRTMYQLFVPVVLVILLFEGANWRFAFTRWLLVIAGFLLVVLPWSVHVSQRTGDAMLLTANGGETLAGGLNPELFRQDGRIVAVENRSTWIGPGKWLPMDQTGYLSPEDMRLPYREKDRLLRERTMAWILANPGDAAYLTLRKLGYQWGLYPALRGGPLQVLAGNIPSILLLLGFLAALALQPAARALGARFALLPVFVTGIAIISWGSWRFRHPADAAMIAVVTVALMTWLRHRQTKAGDTLARA